MAKKGFAKEFLSQKPKYSKEESNAFEKGAKNINWGKPTKPYKRF